MVDGVWDTKLQSRMWIQESKSNFKDNTSDYHFLLPIKFAPFRNCIGIWQLHHCRTLTWTMQTNHLQEGSSSLGEGGWWDQEMPPCHICGLHVCSQQDNKWISKCWYGPVQWIVRYHEVLKQFVQSRKFYGELEPHYRCIPLVIPLKIVWIWYSSFARSNSSRKGRNIWQLISGKRLNWEVHRKALRGLGDLMRGALTPAAECLSIVLHSSLSISTEPCLKKKWKS